MFIMMNNARLAVGIQGLAIAERAYQHAVAYARQRVQGAPVDGTKGAPILHHPDVRRNLLTMRALTEGMRALVLYCAGALDRAKQHPDAAEQLRNQALTDLLIPIAKAWCTDQGVRVASIGVQVHGGVGFIEETGAAQYFRDSRIAPIYEGTNGIQAMDLLGRKLLRDKGQAMQALIAEISDSLETLDDKPALAAALHQMEQATTALLKTGQSDLPAALAVATPYLGLCGTVIAGWLLARAAREARNQSGLAPDFVAAKQATAAFFISNILVEAESEAARVTKGGTSTLAFPLDAF
jgi:3-(methylthio)propanoyl-CoA dehydrogenase